jgi:hypothetical protein
MDAIIRRLADCVYDILCDSLLDYLSDQLLVNLLMLLVSVLVIGPAVTVWAWWVTSEGPISKTQP